MHRSKLQNTLYEIIFGTETPAGKNFDIALIIAICASVFFVILDSIPSLHSSYKHQFFVIEWVFTLLFTAEYLTRLYCSPSAWRYARSFYGIVDLLSILPSYLAFFIPEAQFFLIIRLLRVLRVFRVFKLIRYTGEANMLMRSLWQARRKIQVFLFTVMIFTTLFGTIVYVIEGPDNGFSSIPKSIYWAIVTITTVGYGDLVPQTPFGQAIAALTMIMGYSIIAVPTGIVTAELAQEISRERKNIRCHQCQRGGHDTDAEFCKYCGSTIAEKAKDFAKPKDTAAD